MHFTFCGRCKKHRDQHFVHHDPWDGRYIHHPHKYEPVLYMWVHFAIAVTSGAIAAISIFML